MSATETELEVVGPSNPNGPERSKDYALVMTPCLTKNVIIAETFGIVDYGVDMPAHDNARLLAAAWNSYQRTAARTGADPVVLAEADVLRKAHEACCKLVEWATVARTWSMPPTEAIALATQVCAACLPNK